LVLFLPYPTLPCALMAAGYPLRLTENKHSPTKGRESSPPYPHLVPCHGCVMLSFLHKTSDTHYGSSMLALTYTINALDDHLPSRCITSGLAPIAANLVAPPILPEYIVNSSETNRAFSPTLPFPTLLFRPLPNP